MQCSREIHSVPLRKCCDDRRSAVYVMREEMEDIIVSHKLMFGSVRDIHSVSKRQNNCEDRRSAVYVIRTEREDIFVALKCFARKNSIQNTPHAQGIW